MTLMDICAKLQQTPWHVLLSTHKQDSGMRATITSPESKNNAEWDRKLFVALYQ
jgi:hypothetical protein